MSMERRRAFWPCCDHYPPMTCRASPLITVLMPTLSFLLSMRPERFFCRNSHLPLKCSCDFFVQMVRCQSGGANYLRVGSNCWRSSAERREDGTAIDVPPSDLIEAAERLACFTLLSGREIVDLGDTPGASALGLIDLGPLPIGFRPLDDSLARAVGRSAFCDREGPNRFRFGHRQFAEYLAGRRLATLPLHQSRSLLASGLGWQAGVAGPLRETASFAAMESSDIAEWVADSDPEVVGLSDVADDRLRRQATLNLLSRFRQQKLTGADRSWRAGVGRVSIPWCRRRPSSSDSEPRA